MSYPASMYRRPGFGPVPGLRRLSRLEKLAARVPGVPRLASDVAASLFALFGLFFFSGSMVAILTAEGATSSPKVQFLGLALGLVAAVDFALRQGAIGRLSRYYWPALVPIGLVIASIFWSVDPVLSGRRVMALLCATTFAFWTYERFHDRGLFALVAGAALIIVVLNVATSVAVPSIGVHPALTDLGEPNPHVGAWRGLFDHKNDFGRMMALCVLILWIAYGACRSWRPVVALGLVLGYVGVAGSTSGQAAFLSVAVPLLVRTIALLRPLSPERRAMVVAAAVPAMITAHLFSQILVTFVLGLLGKDPSLTGRTDIWMGTLQAIRGNMALGGGFGAGWDLVGERLFILTGIDVGHAHNGYLDLVTDLGVVGLVILILFYIAIFLTAIRAYFADRASETALFAAGISAFALIGNWVASFLILHNSIYWVLPVLCVMSLRRAQDMKQHRMPGLPGQPVVMDPVPPNRSAPSWSLSGHSRARLGHMKRPLLGAPANPRSLR